MGEGLEAGDGATEYKRVDIVGACNNQLVFTHQHRIMT